MISCTSSTSGAIGLNLDPWPKSNPPEGGVFHDAPMGWEEDMQTDFAFFFWPEDVGEVSGELSARRFFDFLEVTGSQSFCSGVLGESLFLGDWPGVLGD